MEFGTKPLIVGRLSGSDIQVHDSFISRVHCGISYVNGQFTLKDLGSTNRTYRNGALVFEGNLSTGDKIQLGNTTLIFEIESGNGVLRQIPQMNAPPRPIPTAAPPPPSQTNHTAEVKLPSKPPTPPTGVVTS